MEKEEKWHFLWKDSSESETTGRTRVPENKNASGGKSEGVRGRNRSVIAVTAGS